MKPFLLKPHCKDYIWGGNRLRGFGKVSDADRIAESWELSCHPDGESIIVSGESEGMTLTAFLREHPEAAGKNCAQFETFPVIVKLIDACQNLSVQVHPDKTELWYIIDAKPDACILFGFRNEISRTELQEAIETGTICRQMQQIPVKPGDVFLIPSGTLHAIGAGILLAEVQQNSNTTYRVYDYERGRELHIAQALEITDLSPAQNPPAKSWHRIPESASRFRKLGRCKYFSTAVYQIEGYLCFHGEHSFIHLLTLDGEFELVSQGEKLTLAKGSSVFVPAETGFEIYGHGSLLTVHVKAV